LFRTAGKVVARKAREQGGGAGKNTTSDNIYYVSLSVMKKKKAAFWGWRPVSSNLNVETCPHAIFDD